MEPGPQDKPQQRYHAYLIRFRYAENAGRPVWRVAVQAPGSDVERHFANLPALWRFLTAQLGLVDEAGPPAPMDEAGSARK